MHTAFSVRRSDITHFIYIITNNIEATKVYVMFEFLVGIQESVNHKLRFPSDLEHLLQY